MSDAQDVTWIAEKHIAIEVDLDGRARRRWAAAEARSLGWGRTAAVAKATGISDSTIRRGIFEFNDPDAASVNRQRRSGAARKSHEIEQPQLKKALESRSGLTRLSAEPQLPKTFCTFMWENSFSWRFPFSARVLASRFDWLLPLPNPRPHPLLHTPIQFRRQRPQ